MKRLIFLFPLIACAQVQTIPNTTFPAVRTLLNSNFSWLNTNKSPLAHVHIIGNITGLQSALDAKAPLTAITHTITIPIAGSPIATGTSSVGIPGTANFSCTISKAQIAANASGSITVDIWKAAGAIPGSGDKISASAPAALSSAQLNQVGPTLTTWTKTVTVGDVFWASVATADGSLTSVSVTLTCQ